MNEEARVKARIDMLARIFKGRLHVRFQKLDEAFALCRAGGDNEAHLVELHRLLHSLGEAATSFGFEDLGVRASFVELQVKDLLGQPDKHRHDIDDIGQALAALQRSN